MNDMAAQWNKLIEAFPLLVSGALTVAAAFAILIVGYIFARLFRRTIRKPSFGGERLHLDSTLRPVLASAAFYVIFAMALYGFLIKLGVPPESLLAVFGAAGLAIGLALKDTLSNVAAGVMMLTLRPLQVGEFVETPNGAGTVAEIGLFITTLKTADGLFVYVPNSQIVNGRIQNFSRHTERRVQVDVGVGYETDLDAAKAIILDTLRGLPDVQDIPIPPEVFVTTFGDSAISVTARAWLPGDNWMARSSEAHIAVKDALDAAGIEIPFPQRVVVNKTVAPPTAPKKANAKAKG